MNEQRKTARLQFVPFLARLFGGQTFTHTGSLPLRNPQALTLESVELSEQIISKGVWFSLNKICGWQNVDFINADEKRKTGKLWQQQNLSPFSFSDYSMDLLLHYFNQTGSSHPNHPGASPQLPHSDGDLLLNWLVLEHWLPRKSTTLEKSLFKHNPLCILAYPQTFDVKMSQVALQRLLEKPWRALIPWLSQHWLGCWRRHESQRWQNLKKLDFHTRKQNKIFQRWMKQLEENGLYDLMIVFIHFYAELLQQANPERLRHFIRSQSVSNRLSERQNIINLCRRVYEPASYLEGVYNGLKQTHPIERDERMGLFMNTYVKAQLDQNLQQWRSHRETLNRTIH